jgi:hypothetical protein
MLHTYQQASNSHTFHYACIVVPLLNTALQSGVGSILSRSYCWSCTCKFDHHSSDFYLICFLYFLLIFFFNSAPHHLVSFNFYVKFNSHSFDYCLFIFFSIPNWILWSLNIWFQIIFISSLVIILLLFYSFFIVLFFNFISRYFIDFKFCFFIF